MHRAHLPKLLASPIVVMAALADVDSITSWVKLMTEDGTPYYFHPVLNTTQWEEPAEYLDPDDDGEQQEEAAAVADGGGFEKSEPDPQEEEYGQEEYGQEEYGQGEYGQEKASTPASSTAPAAPAPKAAARSSGRRRSQPKYLVQMTESFGQGTGEDAGETYYVNLETGETLWDKPEDFIDEVDGEGGAGNPFADEEEDIEPWSEVTEDDTLEDCFNALAFYSSAAASERAAMVNGDASAGKNVRRRLAFLLEMFHSVGSEDDWLGYVEENDFQLAQTLFECWSLRSSRHVRLLVCRILVMISKLNPQILVFIGAEEWGTLSSIYAIVQQGAKDAPKFDNLSDEAFLCWMFFVHGLFTECQEYGMAAEAMPSQSFCSNMLDLMIDASEEVFLNSCKALIAMAVHYEDLNSNNFLLALHSHPDNQHFGEAAIHILNEQHYPYDEPVLLTQTLGVFKDLFSLNLTAKYFFTNDMKVLVDICVRELGNLPAEDDIIASYLRVINALLQNSQWLQQHRYRREDVCEVLERILDAGGDEEGNGYSVIAVDTVRQVLEDCASLLEE